MTNAFLCSTFMTAAKDTVGSLRRGSTVRVAITFFDQAIAARVPQLLQQKGAKVGQASGEGGTLIRSDTLYPILNAYLRAL